MAEPEAPVDSPEFCRKAIPEKRVKGHPRSKADIHLGMNDPRAQMSKSLKVTCDPREFPHPNTILLIQCPVPIVYIWRMYSRFVSIIFFKMIIYEVIIYEMIYF